MSIADTTERVLALEQALGDPNAEDSALSFRRSLELDECEALPEREYEALRRFGLQAHFVPRALGGELGSLDGFVLVLRSVFRRDPAIGLGFGMSSFIAALPLWLNGTPEQKSALADRLLNGGAVAALLSEPVPRNEMTDSPFTARREGSSFVLEGQKDLIINIARADSALLCANTVIAPAPGYRSHSLFLLERRDLAAGVMLPRRRTLGARACDLRGWNAAGVRIPGSALVGGEGGAFDGISLAFQVSRAVTSGVVIGVADSAWRLCFSFLRSRKLYGKTALELPLVRRDLGAVFADILASDAAALSVARLAQALPGQLCLASAALNALAPLRMASVMKRLSVLLGARHYLREGDHAIFQKTERDLTGLFWEHASTDACPGLLAFQVREIAHFNARPGTSSACAPADWERLESAFRLSRPLPDWEPGCLALGCQGRDLLFEALPGLLERISGLDRAAQAIHALGALVLERRKNLLKEVRERFADLSPEHPAWGRVSGDYCRVYLAACVLFSWHHNREELSRPGALGPGLGFGAAENYDLLFLRALGQMLEAETRDSAWVQAALDEMSRCADEGLSIGLLRIPQARTIAPLRQNFLPLQGETDADKSPKRL